MSESEQFPRPAEAGHPAPPSAAAAGTPPVPYRLPPHRARPARRPNGHHVVTFTRLRMPLGCRTIASGARPYGRPSLFPQVQARRRLAPPPEVKNDER